MMVNRCRKANGYCIESPLNREIAASNDRLLPSTVHHASRFGNSGFG